MFAAIVAGFVALLVVAAILVAVYAVLRSRKTENVSVKRDVRSIQSVGVSSLHPDSHRGCRLAASPAEERARQPVANPGDNPKADSPPWALLRAHLRHAGHEAVQHAGACRRIIQEGVRGQPVHYGVLIQLRGGILDADGNVIVKNRTSLTVLAEPDVANDHDVVARLSTVLGVPTGIVRKRIADATSGAQSQRVVASDANMRNVAFIAEHADAFPGITVQTRTVRDYPHGALAWHVTGYTGSVTSDDIARVAEGRDLELGDSVGRSGIEQMYDNLLAGDHGERKVMADAQGNVVEAVSETQPVAGSDVYHSGNRRAVCG